MSTECNFSQVVFGLAPHGSIVDSAKIATFESDQLVEFVETDQVFVTKTRKVLFDQKNFSTSKTSEFEKNQQMAQWVDIEAEKITH